MIDAWEDSERIVSAKLFLRGIQKKKQKTKKKTRERKEKPSINGLNYARVDTVIR